MRVRIRNHLVAQYFPELDRVWGHSESESLAIVRWCLDPSVVAGLELDEFIRRVTRRDRGVRQRARLEGNLEDGGGLCGVPGAGSRLG